MQYFNAVLVIRNLQLIDINSQNDLMDHALLFYTKHIIMIWYMSNTSYIIIHSSIQHIFVHSICYEHNRCSHVKFRSNDIFCEISRQR